MTRIIAGSARGRTVRTPAGDRTRPTTDRVREALFSALESAIGPMTGLRFLDLYAGSGAVGLEAVSRGAEATLVESDRATARLIGGNAASLGLGAVEVIGRPVEKVVRHPPTTVFDVVFLDPPYAVANRDLEEVLRGLVDQGWLTPETELVCERSARSPEPAWPAGWGPARRRDYGETTLWFLGRETAPG